MLSLMTHPRILFPTVTNISHFICLTLRPYHISGRNKYWLLCLPDGKATEYEARSAITSAVGNSSFPFLVVVV